MAAGRGGVASPRPLPRSFYSRPSTVVGPDLLGRNVVRRVAGTTLVARIVECEAYQEDDPASHSFRGVTARTRVMFGPPGHLYVYFTYGTHFAMNVVTGRDGEGSAVLLRAAEPLRGRGQMAIARGLSNPRLLCSGPGRLTQALSIDRGHDGVDLTMGGDLFVAAGRPVPADQIRVGPRIGISVGRDRPWRFFEADSAFVSKRPRAGEAVAWASDPRATGG